MRLLKLKSTLDHIPSQAAPMVPEGNMSIRKINEIEFSIPDDKQEHINPYGCEKPPLIEYEKGIPVCPDYVERDFQE